MLFINWNEMRRNWFDWRSKAEQLMNLKFFKKFKHKNDLIGMKIKNKLLQFLCEHLQYLHLLQKYELLFLHHLFFFKKKKSFIFVFWTQKHNCFIPLCGILIFTFSRSSMPFTVSPFGPTISKKQLLKKNLKKLKIQS